MGSRIDTSLVLYALLMALWRRQPRAPVMVHPDQGCQFTGHEWQTLLCDHNLGQQHEPTWQLPRQRCGRELLPTAQARTYPPANLRNP